MEKQGINLTSEGNLQEFLGVRIERQGQNRWILTQPHLIQDVINQMNFKNNTKPKKTPASSSNQVIIDEAI